MSRTPDIFKPRIDEYFVELFGEEYFDGEVYDAYVEAFDTNAPDDGVFEGELQAEFEMLWYDEWSGQFDDRDDDFPEDEAREVSEQMAQYVVDEMVGETGKASVNFRQSPEVMGSLRDLGSAWTQAAGEDSWYNAWIIVLPEASNMADEKQDEFFDECEETVVGDAVEFTKDFIRDAYEESGEYEDLMVDLDIDAGY